MRCMIIIYIIFLLSACSVKKTTNYHVYRYFNYNNHKSLGYSDTIWYDRINEDTFKVVEHNNGNKETFNVIQKKEYVEIIVKDSTILLYDINKESTKGYKSKTGSFFNVEMIQKVFQKEYTIDNKVYKVYTFIANPSSDSYDYIYYSPDFGFLIYRLEDQNRYKKLTYVNNKFNNIILRLTDQITKDSSIFLLKPLKSNIQFSKDYFQDTK